ncbi:hypothetical protein IFM89_002710 [Coptis chinensis]|uniref:Kinesin motor domain-containing protein n=1 Tax=Coptis chinensis TaxID=261450 RepID=A0A835IM93_9MAGN|nr:hypothetical protein IFM89_002710 [Coptis chinensis]
MNETQLDNKDEPKIKGTEHETLKKKYVDECLERKRLFNQVIELKGNIRVFCRCRPLNQGEVSSGCSSVVEFNSFKDNELQILCGDSSRKLFKFDHVFGPQDDQEAVFAQTSPVVTSVLDGFNVCIFAYGQTGTGKTFTMEGTPESRGVNYRTLEELFRISEERSCTMKYELSVSMLEVYNEKIRDLLVEDSNHGVKKLEIKQAADGTLEVPGLEEACVHSVDEVWKQLKIGSQNRAVGSTNINELSSRSHCLLRVTVKGENLVNGQKTRSHLWLVDLAGRGNCKTVMFVQISPSSADSVETLCSLNFASRVRGVEHGPLHKQADPQELFKYKQMAEKQRQNEKEIMKLQNSLLSLQLRFSAREQLCRSLQEKTRDLESQLAEERKARLQQENRVAAASAKPSSSFAFSYQNQKVWTQKKPPVGPSKSRPPLRGLTNLPSMPKIPCKTGTANHTSTDEKENISGTVRTINTKTLMRPRRVSIAGRPPQALTQFHQPGRQVSIATLHPDSQMLSTTKPADYSTIRTWIPQPQRRVSIATFCPNSHMLSTVKPVDYSNVRTLIPQPKRRVSLSTERRGSQLFSTMTPQNTFKFQTDTGSVRGRLSFARESRRLSKLFSPMPVLKSTPEGEVTPVTGRSKYLGSPSVQVGSWKPKHPTVVALHRKHFVWSPLKQRSQKNDRKSLLPSRTSDC